MLSERLPSGFFKFHVLRLLSERPMYGYELMKVLEEKLEMRVSQSIVYPILHELERRGLAVGEWRRCGDGGGKDGNKGRHRKYYRLTRRGEEELQRLTERLLKFYKILFE
ncbi:MAG: PadR family transcriptional regulator [Candidatus Alkanophagales archaeon]|nr:MAG: PadR family transcriptional regulator [Candidatus Alkanophagales archaeon]